VTGPKVRQPSRGHFIAAKVMVNQWAKSCTRHNVKSTQISAWTHLHQHRRRKQRKLILANIERELMLYWLLEM